MGVCLKKQKGKKKGRKKWQRKRTSKGRSHDLCGSAVSWLKAILSERVQEVRSGQMERLLALARSNQQFFTHDLDAGVIRQLQVVHTTSSPTEGSRPWFSVDSNVFRTMWAEGLNSGILRRKKDGGHVIREHLPDGWYSVHWNGSSPPTGSLGLPVTNCRKSLCCSASKLLSTSTGTALHGYRHNKICHLYRLGCYSMYLWL